MRTQNGLKNKLSFFQRLELFVLMLLAVFFVLPSAHVVHSQEANTDQETNTDFASTLVSYLPQNVTPQEAIELSILFGALTAAFVLSIWVIRERNRVSNLNKVLRSKISQMTSRITQLEALANAEGQAVILWDKADQRPSVTGRLDPVCGAPEKRSAFLAFGRWMAPLSATRLENNITALRDNAVSFLDTFETINGVPIEVSGKTSGGTAIVHFTNLSKERQDYAHLVSEHSKLKGVSEAFRTFFDKLSDPVWMRDENYKLIWVNQAYLNAIGASSSNLETIDELFGAQANIEIRKTLLEKGYYQNDISTVANGDRVIYRVVERRAQLGSVGLAEDRSESESIRFELQKTIRSHEETLDQLTTAVAMFDEQQKLRFYNNAFSELWGLDRAFLESNPDTSMFLDRLRTERKLPEQPEWRRWKDEILSAYRSVESAEHWWYLPNGQTIRVIATPHPKGGLTWVFENLTERIDLESKYKTLMYVQGETLDNLVEGVAVFSSDGFLQLSNPAFSAFWSLEKLLQRDTVHISQIVRETVNTVKDENPWDNFAGIITGFEDGRHEETGRCTLGDTTLVWVAAPLPNGQTMLTFLDVTNSDKLERYLRERNEALEITADIKNRFIQNVSRELRVPLTSISGFAQMLQMQNAGVLTEKQANYVDHIVACSSSLTTLTDNILDLASFDAGMLELDCVDINLKVFLENISDEMQPLHQQHGQELIMHVDPSVVTINADEERIRKVILQLLSNALNHAPHNTQVRLSCARALNTQALAGQNGIEISVSDEGEGISQEELDYIFDRFHTAMPGRKRGSGIGLSIVKSFVELHGGSVHAVSSQGHGTTVSVYLPNKPNETILAAE